MNENIQHKPIIKNFFKKPIILIQSFIYGISSIALIATLISSYSTSSVFEKLLFATLSLVNFLNMVGFIITYAGSRKISESSTPKTGLTILRFMSLSYVFPVLVIAYYLITDIIYDLTKGFTLTHPIVMLFAIPLVLIIAVCIVYMIFRFIFFTNARKNIEVLKTTKLSVVFAISSFVIGVFSIIFAIYSLRNPIVYGYTISIYDVIYIFTLLILSSSFIIDGIIVFLYKNNLNKHVHKNKPPKQANQNNKYTPIRPTQINQPPIQTPQIYYYVQPVQQTIQQPVQQYTQPPVPNTTTTVTNQPIPDGMVACPNCGKILKQGTVFCITCGQKQNQ